jgi:hypothetical protein
LIFTSTTSQSGQYLLTLSTRPSWAFGERGRQSNQEKNHTLLKSDDSRGEKRHRE